MAEGGGSRAADIINLLHEEGDGLKMVVDWEVAEGEVAEEDRGLDGRLGLS